MNNNNKATLLGILTSVILAVSVLDWDSLDFTLPSTYIKILAIVLPAIGGSISTIKPKKDNEQTS